jgi:hypothetical protein
MASQITIKFMPSMVHKMLLSCLPQLVGPGSSVGIATDYGLDGPGIGSRWGREFARPSSLFLRPTQPPIRTMGTGSFSGVKRPGRGADHPPPSSAEVKKE